MSESITIQIINWQKYNPRKDVHKPSWFKMDHDILLDPKIRGLSKPEKVALWALLSESSRQHSDGLILVDRAFFVRCYDVSWSLILRCIFKLEQNQFVTKIHGTYTVRERAPEQNRIEKNRIEKKKTIAQSTENPKTEIPKASSRRAFDFDSLYFKYPRKLGKNSGMKKLKNQISTEEDYQLFQVAIDAFVAYHKKQCTEPQFIPYFSTFVGGWRDWIDPATGTAIASGGFRGIEEILKEFGEDDGTARVQS